MTAFTRIPDTGVTCSVKPRLLTSKMGDGYQQDVPDGINHIVRSYSVKFSGLFATEMASLIDFFETQGGHLAFDWTPPGSSAGRYVCQEWSENHEAGASTLSCTFQQVFGK